MGYCKEGGEGGGGRPILPVDKSPAHLLASHLLQHVLLNHQNGVKQLLPFGMIRGVFCHPPLPLFFLILSQLERKGEGEGEGERKEEGRDWGESKRGKRNTYVRMYETRCILPRRHSQPSTASVCLLQTSVHVALTALNTAIHCKGKESFKDHSGLSAQGNMLWDAHRFPCSSP